MVKVTDISESLRQIDGARIDDITSVNHKPHRFMIGSQHVVLAADHYCGRLGTEVMEKIGCAMPLCGRPLSEHTHDTVAVIKITKDVADADLRAWLLLVNAEIEGKGVDGYAFVKAGGTILPRQEGV